MQLDLGARSLLTRGSESPRSRLTPLSGGLGAPADRSSAVKGRLRHHGNHGRVRRPDVRRRSQHKSSGAAPQTPGIASEALSTAHCPLPVPSQRLASPDPRLPQNDEAGGSLHGGHRGPGREGAMVTRPDRGLRLVNREGAGPTAERAGPAGEGRAAQARCGRGGGRRGLEDAGRRTAPEVVRGPSRGSGAPGPRRASLFPTRGARLRSLAAPGLRLSLPQLFCF